MAEEKRFRKVKASFSDTTYCDLVLSAAFHSTTVAERINDIVERELYGEIVGMERLARKLNQSHPRAPVRTDA